MKTTENKSTHSQQHTQTEHSFGEQEGERAFFSEPAPQQTPFFNPGAASWVQPKFIGEQTPFFSPSSIATIQRMPAFESEENPVQAKIAPGRAATTPQIQLADTKEQEPEEDTNTDTDLQAKLPSNAVDPPEDGGESSEGLPFTQAKLTIGKPNDRYEREADAIANQVVAMPKQRATLAPGLQTKPLSKTITKLAQRQVASVQPKRLQRLPKVQKQGDGNLKATSDVASRLSSTRGRGSNLDEDTRGEMESNFGADFGDVRVHTDSEATQLSQDLGAKAFTHGSDIYFNQGQYNPNSSEGKHLLAHELTHTVQQGASIQRKVNISTSKAPNLQLFWGAIKEAAIRKFKAGLNSLAENIIPGYTLLNVVLGKNLITGDAVARSGVNLIKGYMRLIPVLGSILLKELEETESLPQAGKWVEGKVAEFGIDFDDIARRLKLMWDEMSITKGIEGNIGIFKKYLGPVIGKIMAFSSVVMEKVKELRFEAALRLVGAGELLDALKKDPKAFKKAVDDPKTVLKQFMVGALKKGFANFKDNFITHFKGALLGWLFGKAAQMGVQMPKKFDIAGLFSLIAQLVGATYTQIRAMVVKRLGPKGEMIVSKLEATVTFIKDLVTKGPIALWERVKDFLSNLKEMVFSKIATLVSTEIIKAAVTKLLSMLNPAGAIVQLAMTLYRVIKFFIDNWETIKSVAMGILNSIGMVALNKIGPAAAFVEKVLAQGMKLIIGFLARIFGLGGIVDKVKALIKKISDPVKMAIGKVIEWIVAKGKKLFRKGKKGLKKLKEWWKVRKSFTTKDGEKHQIWTKKKGKKIIVMMASDQPQEVENILKAAEKIGAAINTPEGKALLNDVVLARQNLIQLKVEAEKDQPGNTKTVDQLTDKLSKSIKNNFSNQAIAMFAFFRLESDFAAKPYQNFSESDPKPKFAPASNSTEGYAKSSESIWQKKDYEEFLKSKFSSKISLKDQTIRKQISRAYDHKLYSRVGGETSQSYIFVEPLSAQDKVSIDLTATGIDTDLQEIVNKNGIIEFMHQISQGEEFKTKEKVKVINKAWLDKKLKDDPETRKWMADKFRGVKPGKHEWIPASKIRKVIELAANDPSKSGDEVGKWIALQDELRSDTSWVVFKPITEATNEEKIVNEKGETVTYVIINGHPGALYYKPFNEKRESRKQATVGSPTFHKQLEVNFADDSNPTVDEAITDAGKVLDKWVWNDDEVPDNVHPTLQTKDGTLINDNKDKFKEQQKQKFQEMKEHFKSLLSPEPPTKKPRTE